nr:hypothetical protein 13 [Desulfobulbaceae bacterium]
MDLNITEEQQKAFEEKHKDLIFRIAKAYGEALDRRDLTEIALLAAHLQYMAGLVAERLEKLDKKQGPWSWNFGPSQ